MTFWYEDGQIKEEVNFIDGKYDGKATWWYENGQISGIYNYKDGKLHGKGTSWNENGQISETNYKDGVCISGDC